VSVSHTAAADLSKPSPSSYGVSFGNLALLQPPEFPSAPGDLGMLVGGWCRLLISTCAACVGARVGAPFLFSCVLRASGGPCPLLTTRSTTSIRYQECPVRVPPQYSVVSGPVQPPQLKAGPSGPRYSDAWRRKKEEL
jgi:hypothetical protein